MRARELSASASANVSSAEINGLRVYSLRVSMLAHRLDAADNARSLSHSATPSSKER
jgi:hypothetical protein